MNRRAGWVMIVALVGLTSVLVGSGCATRAADEALERPTTTTVSTSSTTTSTTTTTVLPTTTASTTTTALPTTTVPPTTVPPDTTLPALVPGGSCELGSHPDCIDPEGDGVGTYLLFGADCMASFPDSPELCADLDEDGIAGYPDSG